MFQPIFLTLSKPQRDAWSQIITPFKHWRREGQRDGALDEVTINRAPLTIEWCDVVDMHRCQGNDHRIYAGEHQSMSLLLQRAYQQYIHEIPQAMEL